MKSGLKSRSAVGFGFLRLQVEVRLGFRALQTVASLRQRNRQMGHFPPNICRGLGDQNCFSGTAAKTSSSQASGIGCTERREADERCQRSGSCLPLSRGTTPGE